jgi:spermidine/putrescine-binding protein
LILCRNNFSQNGENINQKIHLLSNNFSCLEILQNSNFNKKRRKSMSAKNSNMISEISKDRRDFMKKLGSLGLAFISLPLVSRIANAKSSMKCISWTNYHVPPLHPQYVEKYAESPSATFMTDDEDAFQKLRAGFEVDTAHPNTTSVGRFRDAGLIKPIDVSRLKNWPDVFEEIKNVKGVKFDGKFFIVPVSFGNTSVIYRTDLVDPKWRNNQSWKILWDPKYKGRLACSNVTDDIILPAALIAGVNDPFAMTDQELEEVKRLLREQRDNLRYYWDNFTDMEQAIASGELVASIGWNTSVTTLKKEGVPVSYMVPKEGILTWLDGVVYAKSSKAPVTEVYDFMDAWLSPEAGKYLIESIGYGHTNRRSFEVADKNRLAELDMLDPVKTLKKGIFFEALEPKLREKYARIVEEVKAGF